jgi:hypothetical protein
MNIDKRNEHTKHQQTSLLIKRVILTLKHLVFHECHNFLVKVYHRLSMMMFCYNSIFLLQFFFVQYVIAKQSLMLQKKLSDLLSNYLQQGPS